MRIDPSDSPPVQSMPLHEAEDFVVLGQLRRGKYAEEREDLLTVLEPPTGEFSNHEGVREDEGVLKERRESRVPYA